MLCGKAILIMGVMANPSKRIGTAGENEVLAVLREIWPSLDVTRSATNTASNDFHGQPFPVESKKRATWALKDWIRRIVKVSAGGPWAIYCSDSDKRKTDSFPDVVILPRFFATVLLKHYYEAPEPKTTRSTDCFS